MKKKHFAVCVFLISLTLSSCGLSKPTTGTIKRTITQNGSPVSNAKVSANEEVQTGADGQFEFSKVKPGGYVIYIENIKIDGKDCSIADFDVVVKAGETTTKDYDLDNLRSGLIVACK